ncbi:uncharacterized protein LOC127899053 [Citrus sinensis]|uniref:uncharacterized protein LOC127899053 n=1 Tax=Citrus sinensis TaxID=2711 RepID=UPI002277F6CC|nr:uncharacterized protein LOC127899053 [Citrus sinensis]
MRPDPLLKKGYRYGWFLTEGEWGRSIPAGNEIVQVWNFFNEDNITWTKGTCLVHEVGRKVSGVIEKFQFLQSEGDVLSTTRLVRAGLIEESFPSSSGGDSCMGPFAEDFDAFFSRMSGSSFDTLGTSAKGDRPPVIPGGKGKLPVSFLGGSRGTLAAHKRKFDSLFTALGDLMEGELDPVANKQISHLTNYFFHFSESISTDMAMKVDKLDLSERYSRALKVCHDAAFYLSHGLRDLSGISVTQTEVERLRCEVRLG